MKKSNDRVAKAVMVVVGLTVIVFIWGGVVMRVASAQEGGAVQEPGAQFQPPPPPGAPGFPGRPGAPGLGGMPGFGGPRFGGPPGGAAIAVAGDSVFIVQGNNLYKFAASDLKLIKKVTLEEGPPGPPRLREGAPGGRRPGGEGRRGEGRGEGER